MVRQHRKIRVNDNQMRIAVLTMAVFLVSTALGAILCNGFYGAKAQEMGVELHTFFSGIRENGVSGNFASVYFKYIKYGLFIWMGGFLAYGVIISGVALCFRGVCLGFTTAILLNTYGLKGFLAATLTILPQNMILIPVYVCLTWAAVCFWYKRHNRGIGKAGLRRERNKQLTEYSIFLCGALLLTAVATFIETSVIPFVMESVAVFLV